MEKSIKKIQQSKLSFADKKKILEIFGIQLVEKKKGESSGFSIETNNNGLSTYLLLDIPVNGWGGFDPSGSFDMTGFFDLGSGFTFDGSFDIGGGDFSI